MKHSGTKLSEAKGMTKTMIDPNTANYYALLIAILCNESAKEVLKDMGVCPDNFD